MLQGKQLDKRLKEYHQKIFLQELTKSILKSKRITLDPIYNPMENPVMPLTAIIENLYPPIYQSNNATIPSDPLPFE